MYFNGECAVRHIFPGMTENIKLLFQTSFLVADQAHILTILSKL